MTWFYQDNAVTTVPEDVVGFVYLITNMSSGRMYIGKKLFHFSKTTYKTVKLKNGTKKRKKIRGKVESDWQDYYGSSDALLKDIELIGKDKFKREILYFCKSKAECSYVEMREQVMRKVLESDEYYNGIIQVKIHKNHIINGKTKI